MIAGPCIALVLRVNVNFALRLLLITVLLISQVSIGASACACPARASSAAPQSASAMKCPVTGKVGCLCCQADDEPRQELVARVIAKDPGTCNVVSSRTPCAEPVRKALQVTRAVAIQPEPVKLNDRLAPAPVNSPPCFNKTVTTSSDIRAHGLRAPPVR